MQEQGKYLYTPYLKGGGLDAVITDIVRLIQAALIMKRIPIIRQRVTSKAHRLDKLHKQTCIDWERYIDLPRTKIFKVGPKGSIKEPTTLQYIYEQDFNDNLYSRNQVRYIDYTQVHDPENDNYPVICILNPRDISERKKLPELHEKRKGLLNLRTSPPFLIIFSPSKIVNDLTDIVLNHFGVTRERAESLSNILYDLPKIKYSDMEFYYKDLNYYACMHVRYGGNVNHASRLIKRTPQRLSMAIKRVLRVIYERNHKNLPLYIMSNIKDVHYFDFLKPDYDIYRYTDFKELREQFTLQEEIEHNLLYAVEKNIMRHATVKILPSSRNRFIFECPWQNTTSVFEEVLWGM